MIRRALVAVAALLALPSPTTLGAQERQIAITVDDLPFVPATVAVAEQERHTDSLLAAFRRYDVPAIGFVNETHLGDSTGAVDPRRVALLARWLDHGMDLGNHTFSHPDLHRTLLVDFQAEVLKGERVTRQLLAERGQRPHFFRHPYLHTGRSVAVRDSLEEFLASRGYRVAPVTVDNYDYVFARAFHLAREQGDPALAARVAGTYLDYMDSVVVFYEGQALAIVGRDIPQVLLLHANALNAGTFPALAERLRARGYRFISLERALEDPAYRLPDQYAGPAGITWLHRWAITKGTPGSVFAGEPAVPGWVEEEAAARP